jgi:hypothetical protein
MEQEQEETVNPLWSRTAVCSCTGGGKPTMLQGEMVIFRNPACRVHQVVAVANPYAAVSAEAVVGSFKGRERKFGESSERSILAFCDSIMNAK